MATRKTTVTSKAKSKPKSPAQGLFEHSHVDLEALAIELGTMVKGAKAKYDGLDTKTKKQVIAGIAGASALLAGAVGYGVMHKGRSKPRAKTAKKTR